MGNEKKQRHKLATYTTHFRGKFLSSSADKLRVGQKIDVSCLASPLPLIVSLTHTHLHPFSLARAQTLGLRADSPSPYRGNNCKHVSLAKGGDFVIFFTFLCLDAASCAAPVAAAVADAGVSVGSQG